MPTAGTAPGKETASGSPTCAEISVADGELLRIAYARRGADPGNVIFAWGPLAIDPSGRHALIAYSGNLGRIDLSTGQLTELPMEETGPSTSPGSTRH